MQQVPRHEAKRTGDWVLTGTPFDEDQVPPKQSQSQKIAPTLEFFQQVRDENGRQRLHGAFKGGFSAGYFNSVGSKEGWTPSSFYSSRTKRARQEPRNRLEGLIDEEDVEDDDPIFSIGGFPLDVKPYFGCLGNHESHRASRQSKKGAFEGASSQLFSEDILQVSPESFSLGFQMLRKLGWRDTRVIGEEGNVKNAPVVKVYGPELPLKSHQVSWRVDSLRSEDDISGIGYNTENILDWKGPKRETTQGLLYQTQSISYLEEDDDEYDVFDNQQEDYLQSIQDAVEKRAKLSKKGADDFKEVDKPSSNDAFLAGKLQFHMANEQKKRKVYSAPTVPEMYDFRFCPDKDKYAYNTSTCGIQTTKRLLSSVKNAADRRILLGESLISVSGPKKKVDLTDTGEQQLVDNSKGPTTGLSKEILDKLNKSMTERFTSSSEDNNNRASQETHSKVLEDTRKSQGLPVGQSKREIRFWQPSRLLCKRFNVPQPTVTGETSKRTTSRIYSELPVFETEKSVDQKTEDKSQRDDIKADTMDEEKEETSLINSEFLRLRSERPSTELFRAIFDEDSEEEEFVETNELPEDSLLYVRPKSQDKKTAVNNSKAIQRPRAVDYF
ncbi:G patch domain-containing protein TGH [Galdieria sulphuraria]|uniref:G-patch domain-containing protein n=1 Tax=Galdieria sulphuraria TaxID=130081 RepID=M2Y672_GALSU|nr:uncharacterized protein Gasu_11940 [Galdieria sulphuraria]EME31518.1 hypothetical protein Gasu_11940 [Galdieria sulphuraria]GJD10227.1 G patch domain-containing protein TGH [Galdieria sulphuraria]|eukprot:XP_005708038.1 hypothetical protein Gasu_11940 [Galdieria sulphuraria]